MKYHCTSEIINLSDERMYSRNYGRDFGTPWITILLDPFVIIFNKNDSRLKWPSTPYVFTKFYFRINVKFWKYYISLSTLKMFLFTRNSSVLMILFESCSNVAANYPGFMLENWIKRCGGQGNTRFNVFCFPLWM